MPRWRFPPGSDLVVEFYMQDNNLPNPNEEAYANAWYNYNHNTTWYRMNGVGADTNEGYHRFRFVVEPPPNTFPDLVVEFRIPDYAASVNNTQGINVDDFSLDWYRASLDTVGSFSDVGNGTYTADFTSEQSGDATIMCIFYGNDPPLMTDGTNSNSNGYAIVITD